MRTLYSLFLISIPMVLCAQGDSVHSSSGYDSIHLIVRQMMNREVLSGLREMHLVVGTTDTSLRSEVENRLRSNGIPFVTRYIEALHQRGSPTLYVDLIRPRAGTNVYHATVELKEEVSLGRNKAQTVSSAVTWSTERFVQDDQRQKRARAAVLDAVDEFVKGYHDANRQR